MKLPWTTTIMETFATNGMLLDFRKYSEKCSKKQISCSNKLFRRLEDQFHQTAFAEIKASNKLTLYSLLKTEKGYENYLQEINNIKHRQAMTRLRLSSHSLNIESGRHKDIQRQDRICPLCKKNIEDVTHFIISCPFYDKIRMSLLTVPTIGNDLEKTKVILKSDDLKNVAKFTFEAFSHRQTILDVENIVTDMINKVISTVNTKKYHIVSHSQNYMKVTFRKGPPSRKIPKLDLP